MAHDQGPSQRIRLIRPKVNKIQQNLEPLIHNTRKHVAQTLYYQNHPEHQSPLMRDQKGPVHQRLGAKQIRLRRIVPLGTNTSSVLPKRKMLKYSKVDNYKRSNINKQQGRPQQFRNFKLNRMYSAQARIEKIRALQRNTIKLRRLNNGITPKPTNLTVEVKNPNFMPNSNDVSHAHRHKMVLNPEIQACILEIQNTSPGLPNPLPPLTRITPAITLINMSDRFSCL